MEQTKEFVETMAEPWVQNMNRVSYVQWYFISLVNSTCPTGTPKVARYGYDGWMVFSSVCCHRTRGNCFKLKECQFILDIRKKTYKKGDNTLKEFAQRYSRLPIPGIFKVRLNVVSWTRGSLKVQPHLFNHALYGTVVEVIDFSTCLKCTSPYISLSYKIIVTICFLTVASFKSFLCLPPVCIVNEYYILLWELSLT